MAYTIMFIALKNSKLSHRNDLSKNETNSEHCSEGVVLWPQLSLHNCTLWSQMLREDNAKGVLLKSAPSGVSWFQEEDAVFKRQL